MLVSALSLLLGQLNQYIHQADGNALGTVAPTVWGNIAQIDHPEIGTDLENKLVLTVVNVEEEKTLKNGTNVTRNPSGAIEYKNPPLHLNVVVLFAANYRNYETALKRLTQVLSFFQGKQRFTLQNSPGAAVDPMTELSLTMDLLSLSFEEVNHLWGSLGGKQLPFAAYRARLVVIDDRRVLDGGGLVREVTVVGRDATA